MKYWVLYILWAPVLGPRNTSQFFVFLSEINAELLPLSNSWKEQQKQEQQKVLEQQRTHGICSVGWMGHRMSLVFSIADWSGWFLWAQPRSQNCLFDKHYSNTSDVLASGRSSVTSGSRLLQSRRPVWPKRRICTVPEISLFENLANKQQNDTKPMILWFHLQPDPKRTSSSKSRGLVQCQAKLEAQLLASREVGLNSFFPTELGLVGH